MPNERSFVRMSSSKKFRVSSLDPQNGRPKQSLGAHKGPVNCLCIHDDLGVVVTGSDDGTLMVHSLAHGSVQATLCGHGASITGVGVLPGGRADETMVVSVSIDTTMRVWHMKSGQLLSTFSPTGE